MIKLVLLVTALGGKSAIGLIEGTRLTAATQGAWITKPPLAAALGLVHGAVGRAAVRRPADIHTQVLPRRIAPCLCRHNCG
jgi:hypothetical protein